MPLTPAQKSCRVVTAKRSYCYCTTGGMQATVWVIPGMSMVPQVHHHLTCLLLHGRNAQPKSSDQANDNRTRPGPNACHP